jgi:hypothetical protein
VFFACGVVQNLIPLFSAQALSWSRFQVIGMAFIG